MPGGWMPQATRLPFASRTGMHTQAGRRSPRRTGSPVTALKTWLGFVLYLRNVTPWKEQLNYKRPGPPGCLLAQAGPQPGGRPGARPLPEPGACVPGPAPLRLCAPEAGHPGTHTLASPRGLAKHSTNRSSAVGTESSGCPETRHPASPKATVPAGPPLVLESPFKCILDKCLPSASGKGRAGAQASGLGPSLRWHSPLCTMRGTVRPECQHQGGARQHPPRGPGALRARRHYKDLSKPQGGRESRRASWSREATRPGVTAAPMDSTPGQTKGLGVIPAGSRTVSPGEKTLPSVRPQRAQSSPPGGLGHGEAPRTDLRMNCAQAGGY